MSRRRVLHEALSDDGERGAGMVIVIAVMMIVGVVSVTLMSTTVFNTSFTAETRAEVRAQAVADAGLDIMLSELDGKTYGELAGMCGTADTIDDIPVQVSTEYALSNGTSVPCPSSATQAAEVVKVTVTSTATTTNPVGADDVARTSVVELLPQPPEVVLDKAIFSEASLVITNNAQIEASEGGDSDAHAYSNGGVECKTQSDLDGAIYAAHGHLVLEDNCDIGGTVWASLSATLKSNSSVAGDLYAASADESWAVHLQNSNTRIDGNLLTNGGVRIDGSSHHVGGSVFARLGKVELPNQAKVEGSVYAGKDIWLQNGASIGKDAVSKAAITINNSGKISGNARATAIASSGLTVSGTRSVEPSVNFPSTLNPSTGQAQAQAVGFPGEIEGPARQQFPKILASEEEYAAWEAAGWDVRQLSGVCGSMQNNPVKKVVGDAQKAGVRTMLVFNDCSGPITLDNSAMTLKNDLAFVSPRGFRSSNNLNVSTTGNAERNLYFIVPANAPGVSWNPAPDGQTAPECYGNNESKIDRFKPKSVSVLIYSPCVFTWQNMHPNDEQYHGQIYAGGVSLPTHFQMQMEMVPVPGVTSGSPSPSSQADMALRARFDVPSD